MTTLPSLIERLEKATKGSLELSGRIRCARYGGEFVEMRGNRVLYKPRHCPWAKWGYQLGRLDNFSTSLDAAVGLVPEGWDWIVGKQSYGDGTFAYWATLGARGRVSKGASGATPALALSSAALKAHQASEEGA